MLEQTFEEVERLKEILENLLENPQLQPRISPKKFAEYFGFYFTPTDNEENKNMNNKRNVLEWVQMVNKEMYESRLLSRYFN